MQSNRIELLGPRIVIKSRVTKFRFDSMYEFAGLMRDNSRCGMTFVDLK